MTKHLGEGVIRLIGLIDTRLRAVVAEAKREVSGVNGGDALSGYVLGMDGEAEAGRIDRGLRNNDRVVESRVVQGEVVDRGGA